MFLEENKIALLSMLGFVDSREALNNVETKVLAIHPAAPGTH